MDGQHVVTLDDAHPDRCTDGSIHTSAGSTDVHDGHIDVALVSKREIYLDLFQIRTIFISIVIGEKSLHPTAGWTSLP